MSLRKSIATLPLAGVDMRYRVEPSPFLQRGFPMNRSVVALFATLASLGVILALAVVNGLATRNIAFADWGEALEAAGLSE